MLRKLSLFASLLLALSISLAAAPPELAAKLDRLRSDPALRDANIGIFIQSLRDGDIWYDYQASDRFIPASNTKIITAALALDHLRPEYTFTTSVLATGDITDGVLQGDLILRGHGDPSLLPEDLQALAQTLAAGDPARNIPSLREVRGRIILDDTFFPRPGALLGTGWEADDLPWYYAAPASALSCSRNAVTVTVRGTEVGKPALVTATPATALFSYENMAMTRGDVKTGAVEVLPNGRRVRIVGRIAPGAELIERISVADPALFTGEIFRAALQRAGITVGEMAKGSAPAEARVLAEHISAPLSTLLQTMLKESDNHYAEQLRWTMLTLYSLEVPLETRYPAMVQDFTTHSGLLSSGLALVDGSGLSRQNTATPIGVSGVLSYLAASPYAATFYEALPIAGVDGTLKKRLLGTPAAGNARAKTGTMRGVSTLAGYVTTTSQQERLVFAIYAGDYRNSAAAARKLQDSIVSYLAGL